MKKEKSVLRKALEDVINLDNDYQNKYAYSYSLSFSDLKVAVESLWNEGITYQYYAPFHDDDDFRLQFLNLAKKYAQLPKPVIKLPNEPKSPPKPEHKKEDQVNIKYWTKRQVLEYLSISERTLYRYNKHKVLPYKKINNRLYYPVDDVKAFIGNHNPTVNNASIDKVTVDRLDVVLRMCNIHLSKVIIDRVIDCVELIEQKGGGVTLEDAIDLQAEWERKAITINDDLEVKYETPFHS
jgi:hypothetical protein